MDVFIAKTNNVSFLENRIGRSIDAGISLVVLGQPDLSFRIDAEVGQFSLGAHGDLPADVGHLQGLLPQVPFVPVVVRVDVLINKVERSLFALVNHQRS